MAVENIKKGIDKDGKINEIEKNSENRQISKGDFIEIVYTGYIKETGKVFDTCDEAEAKREGIQKRVKPVIICVGKADVVEGLDKSFEGRKIGEQYSLDIKECFGKMDAKLIMLVPASAFKGEKITPYPGLEVSIDGRFGIVKTAGSGRILVDFNHPLAGKDILYKVRIERKVSDNKEKIDGFLRLSLGIEDIKSSYENGVCIINLKLPDEIKGQLAEEIKERIGEVKDVKFVEGAVEEMKNKDKDAGQE
ncbi:FKBP-type peptidyl-prolyl cis-trans isomerase [archaeon]|nr:FKBP-type peptidyl-prolyl cis-trans isomerase [archaeon]